MNVTLPPWLLIETEGVPTSRPGIPLGVMVRLMVSEVVDDETLKLPDLPKLTVVLARLSKSFREAISKSISVYL